MQFDSLVGLCWILEAKVAHTRVQISGLDYVIGHGPSKFVKPEKVAALQRQEKDSQPAKFELRDAHSFPTFTICACVCVCVQNDGHA